MSDTIYIQVYDVGCMKPGNKESMGSGLYTHDLEHVKIMLSQAALDKDHIFYVKRRSVLLSNYVWQNILNLSFEQYQQLNAQLGVQVTEADYRLELAKAGC